MKEILDKLKELGGKAPLSCSDKQYIEDKYYLILNKKFRRTSCGDCYRDGAIEAYTYLAKHGKFREPRNYTLKNGVLLQMEFGSREYYTNENITDEVAEKYLRKYPENIKFFANFPADWETRIKSNESKRTEKEKQQTFRRVVPKNTGDTNVRK